MSESIKEYVDELYDGVMSWFNNSCLHSGCLPVCAGIQGGTDTWRSLLYLYSGHRHTVWRPHIHQYLFAKKKYFKKRKAKHNFFTNEDLDPQHQKVIDAL